MRYYHGENNLFKTIEDCINNYQKYTEYIIKIDKYNSLYNQAYNNYMFKELYNSFRINMKR